ncbi:MAG TPA: hypothetical protein VKX34_04560 [Aequorivita sp.]|nr:hypothetical protein [Aequorivita sp.]
MKIQFKEEQKFTQWWLWLILIGIGVMPIIGIYKQIIIGGTYGDNPMSYLGLTIFSLLIYGIIALFLFMRLKTEITQDEISVKFIPFTKRQVNWKEVKSAQIVNYGFVGGWGIRFGTKYGIVYNTRGNKGLAIELLNGKKFLVGTQKESELNLTLQKINELYNL